MSGYEVAFYPDAAKYIREQESHDIALDMLSVKEYEGPFKRR